MSTELPADEADSLVESFWRVARVLRLRSRDSVAPWDMTPSSARALAVLQRHGVMRLSELSEHLRIAARSTTEVVDALQERGLVERRSDPNDRRATLLALTEHGIEVGDAIQAARAEDAERLFAVLTDRDRARLANILRTLADEAGNVSSRERRWRSEPMSTSDARGASRSRKRSADRIERSESRPMSEHPDASRVDERAHLTPEERAAGSDDARLQAEIILEDSDRRTDDPEATKHDSSQTPERQDEHTDLEQA